MDETSALVERYGQNGTKDLAFLPYRRTDRDGAKAVDITQFSFVGKLNEIISNHVGQAVLQKKSGHLLSISPFIG